MAMTTRKFQSPDGTTHTIITVPGGKGDEQLMYHSLCSPVDNRERVANVVHFNSFNDAMKEVNRLDGILRKK